MLIRQRSFKPICVFLLLSITLNASGSVHGAEQEIDERNEISRIIFAEAASGSDYERELVASTMMNRINHPAFGRGKLTSMYEVATFIEASGLHSYSCLDNSGSELWRKSADLNNLNEDEMRIWDNCYLLANGKFQPYNGNSGLPLVYYHDKSIDKPTQWDNEWWNAVNELETDKFLFYSIIAVNKPTLVYPGSSSESGKLINSLSPTFKWIVAPNADSYALYISKYPYGTENIVFNSDNDLSQGSIIGDSFELPFSLQAGTKYRWNMRAHYSSGDLSDFSDPLYFQISSTSIASEETDISTQQNLILNLPVVPSESALSTIPIWDNTHPIVQDFDVSPQSLTCGEFVTIDYSVSDTGGSGLNRVELWRKDEQSDWKEIKRDMVSSCDGPLSASFTDAPSNAGRYLYGIHVADNAGNWNDERNSNSDNQPGGFSPIEVEVSDIQSTVSENNDAISWNEKGVTLYNQGKYEDALECFNEATRIDPNYANAWDNKATVLLALDRCDEFKAADEMAGSLGLINFRNPLTYIKCG